MHLPKEKLIAGFKSTHGGVYMSMTLNQARFTIDSAAVASRLQDFITASFKRLYRSGIVVPISGGLDSSVVATLCVNAIGKDSVTGLLLPERQGNPEADSYARLLARHLDIQTRRVDISPILRALGAYRYPLSLIPGYRLKKAVVRKFMKKAEENPFLTSLRGGGDPLHRKGTASFYAKQRARLIAVYYFAEVRNLLVAGSAHLTEDMVGLYVKFGVDDVADLMPLKHLYRSHIVQLAGYLKVPEEIRGRSPNPDLIPGVTDKYRDMLGIESERVDLILLGIHEKMNDSEIASQVDVPEDKVALIRELFRLSEHMRQPSLAPAQEELLATSTQKQ